jgi:hypothetical protein
MCCGSEQEVHWTRRLRVQGYSPSGALGGTRLVGGARSTSTAFALGVIERWVVSSRCFTGVSADPKNAAAIITFQELFLVKFLTARRRGTCICALDVLKRSLDNLSTNQISCGSDQLFANIS